MLVESKSKVEREKKHVVGEWDICVSCVSYMLNAYGQL